VAGSGKCGDEPLGSGATDLVFVSCRICLCWWIRVRAQNTKTSM
jgi:hypothetical protein